MVVFTSRKIERAKSERIIYSNVEIPTANKFKHMVPTNMISNSSISVEDISNAGKIYNPLIISLK